MSKKRKNNNSNDNDDVTCHETTTLVVDISPQSPIFLLLNPVQHQKKTMLPL